jgi:endonuclease YncB( thermonuclease family)
MVVASRSEQREDIMPMRRLRSVARRSDESGWRWLAALLLLFSLAVLLAWPVRAKDISGAAVVIDGDTLDVNGERIRLHGIDAPESSQSCVVAGLAWPCGREATRFLSDTTGGGTVLCTGAKRDRYGRLIAVCYAGATCINAEMVERGFALAYRKYSLDYVAEEDAARSAGRGLWRGQFTEPWQWRTSHKTLADAAGDVRP